MTQAADGVIIFLAPTLVALVGVLEQADIRILENRENIAVVIKDGKIEVDRR